MAQLVKNLPAMQEDLGSIPGLGRSPGEGNGNPTPIQSGMLNKVTRELRLEGSVRVGQPV